MVKVRNFNDGSATAETNAEGHVGVLLSETRLSYGGSRLFKSERTLFYNVPKDLVDMFKPGATIPDGENLCIANRYSKTPYSDKSEKSMREIEGELVPSTRLFEGDDNPSEYYTYSYLAPKGTADSEEDMAEVAAARAAVTF